MLYQRILFLSSAICTGYYSLRSVLMKEQEEDMNSEGAPLVPFMGVSASSYWNSASSEIESDLPKGSLFSLCFCYT